MQEDTRQDKPSKVYLVADVSRDIIVVELSIAAAFLMIEIKGAEIYAEAVLLIC